MPGVSPDGATTFAKVLGDLYSDATAELIRIVARRLAAGIDEPGWAERKLSEILLLRGDAQALIRSLELQGQSEIVAVVEAAYRAGALRVGATDAAASALVSTNQRAVMAYAAAISGNLRATHTRILSEAETKYRQVIDETTAQVVTGVQDRRRAAAEAYSRLVRNGVTGFVDKKGRNWDLGSYTEMATRTSAGQAHVQGALDRWQADGRDWVVVSDAPEECKLCRPYEGRVLSLRGRPPTEAELGGNRYAGTLKDAQSKGFQHPNCRHALSAFIPGLTRPITDTEDPEGDKLRQEQRSRERDVRSLKRDLMVKQELLGARHPDTQVVRKQLAATRAEFAEWRDANDRKHLAYRENLGAR